MQLVLTDEQEMIRTAARDFVGGKSSLKRVRGLRDSGAFSRDLWRQMADLGWLGLTLPEEYGGAGLGHVAQMLVLEELGRGLCPEPFVSTVLLGQQLILLGGSDEQKKEHLEASAQGERLLAVATDEAGGRFELDRVALKAAPGKNGGVNLRGVKTHVQGGATANAIIVTASTGSGVELYLVPGDAIGLERQNQLRIDGRDCAELHFSGVEVPAKAKLPGGLAALRRTVDRATIGLAAEMLGGASAVFQMTLDYLKTRIQFGVPIGSFQALQHRASKLFVELELMRSSVWRASALLDEPAAIATDDAVARAASIAKAKASEAYMLATHEGLQMHGGIGMTDEHDIGLYLKRARTTEMTFGDAIYHRDRFAKLSGF